MRPMVREGMAAAVGLAWGVTVGSGFLALLSVLDVVPRLVQLTRFKGGLLAYQWALIAGAFISTLSEIFPMPMSLSRWMAAAWGLFAGVFVGMVAGALTEVLNVLPILARRLRLERVLPLLVSAMVIGKMMGCLVNFLFPELSP
ncbi:stage V sporulation protein AB [Kyrpidia spormannii]|uniref:Stage V sporulation protein AB n=1 Tax=Kyrpidia spormannii TaxID=2055160 RepID=A0ACA8Z8N7_9BACL|nr:stage V sporulation protein AB [Kyrpidia spormannii]